MPNEDQHEAAQAKAAEDARRAAQATAAPNARRAAKAKYPRTTLGDGTGTVSG
jgi:hypothetical protein